MSFSKRIFDLTVAGLLTLAFAPLFAAVAVAIVATSGFPIIYASRRVGRNSAIFRMHKFRTMRVDAPQVATHLLQNPDALLTPIGGFLRRTSLDELPQLLDVLSGKMSLVGPRPALFNQDDLVALRTQVGVDALVPGLTGWAQVNGRDELSIPVKVEFDRVYLEKRSLLFDIHILFLTFLKVFKREGVSH